MKIETPKFKKIVWTQHSEIKLKQYGLSKSKISSIIHKPERIEDGIVPGTTAMMRTNPSTCYRSLRASPLDKKLELKFNIWKKIKKAPGEIWVMYKDTTLQHSSGQAVRKIISCWRYPGITKPREKIQIPEDIKIDLQNLK